MPTLISDLISRNSTVTTISLKIMKPLKLQTLLCALASTLIEDFALTQNLLNQVSSEMLHFEALKWA